MLTSSFDRARAGLSAREQYLEEFIFLGNYTKSQEKNKFQIRCSNASMNLANEILICLVYA